MTNHPNRGKDPLTPGRTPRPHEVKEARAARGLTQAMWELYLSKTTVLPVETPKPPPEEETPPDGG